MCFSEYLPNQHLRLRSEQHSKELFRYLRAPQPGFQQQQVSAFIFLSLEVLKIFFFFFFVFLPYLGPIPQHMEIPRLGVESELQVPAHTTATATRDPSLVCDLHHSS